MFSSEGLKRWIDRLLAIIFAGASSLHLLAFGKVFNKVKYSNL
jgi:hypothetical protein